MFLGCCGCNVSWCSVCTECCAFCLTCVACTARCYLMGSMLVSSSSCCVVVFRIHPVGMRSAVFCKFCSLFVFASDRICDQIVLPYSSVVQVMQEYVLSSVSLDLPKCVVVKAFRIFVFFALCCMYFGKASGVEC